MKKIKKSTGVAIAFLIYVSVTAAYLLPRNTEVSQTEKILTVVGSYAIVLLLWLVLRKKEQMRERRKEEQMNESRIIRMIKQRLVLVRKPVHFLPMVLP